VGTLVVLQIQQLRHKQAVEQEVVVMEVEALEDTRVQDLLQDHKLPQELEVQDTEEIVDTEEVAHTVLPELDPDHKPAAGQVVVPGVDTTVRTSTQE